MVSLSAVVTTADGEERIDGADADIKRLADGGACQGVDRTPL